MKPRLQSLLEAMNSNPAPTEAEMLAGEEFSSQIRQALPEPEDKKPLSKEEALERRKKGAIPHRFRMENCTFPPLEIGPPNE